MNETIEQLCEEIYGKNYNKAYEEGYKKGKIRALAWCIKNFMKNCNLSFEEATNIIKVEEEFFERVKELALDKTWNDWEQYLPGIDD